MTSAQEIARRLWRADSVVVLFGTLDPDKLPFEEQVAIGEAQARARDEWLAAYAEFKAGRSAAAPKQPSRPAER